MRKQSFQIIPSEKALYKKQADWRGPDFWHTAKGHKWFKQEQIRRFRRQSKQRIVEMDAK